MSGQWEKYVEIAADEMTGQQIGTGFYSLNVGPSDAREMARAALAVVGPLIAEDTRERMVAAAARAVERTCTSRRTNRGDGRGCEDDRCPRHGGSEEDER